LTEQGKTPMPAELRAGLLCLSVADAIRPDLDFLLSTVRSGHWHKAVAAHRDPAGFARLTSGSDRDLLASQGGRIALGQIATIIIAKGVLGLPPASNSHPPSNQRWDALWPVVEREYVISDAKQPPLHLPAAHLQWYKRMIRELVPAVAARL
jgi:hypothetical protein